MDKQLSMKVMQTFKIKFELPNGSTYNLSMDAENLEEAKKLLASDLEQMLAELRK